LRKSLLLAVAVALSSACAATRIPYSGIALHYASRDIVRVPATTREVDEPRSVGAAFDAAYDLREREGAKRAEPLFEVAIPETAGTRGGGDDENDPRAEADPLWSVKQVGAPKAWEMIRSETGRPPGEEASDPRPSRPGYLRHDEISRRRAELGYDYMDRTTTRPIRSTVPPHNPGNTGSEAIATRRAARPRSLARPTGRPWRAFPFRSGSAAPSWLSIPTIFLAPRDALLRRPLPRQDGHTGRVDGIRPAS
jgi:hypothetical protein